MQRIQSSGSRRTWSRLVIQTVIRAETRPEVTSPNPGEAAGEPEAVVDVTPTLDENGDPLAVVNVSIDTDVNVGLVIPSMELGASLGDEYKNAMENDETLKDWKCWCSARKNGFLRDSGVLKRNVEDEMSVSRSTSGHSGWAEAAYACAGV